MSEEVKASKTVKFSGEREDWAMWKTKFLTRARRRGHRNILKGIEIVPNDKDAKIIEAKSNQDEVDECKKLRELNLEAHEDLMLAMTGDSIKDRVVFNVVEQCANEKFKDGDSR